MNNAEIECSEEIEMIVFEDSDSSKEEIASQDEESKLLINGTINEINTNIDGPNGPKLKKTLNLFNAVTFIVGDIVGSGIFITPTAALSYSGSFGISLIFWAIGGVLAIAGGLVYVELGLMIKDSGADYAYLREGYSFGGKHPALKTIGNTFGFMSVWSNIILIRPLSTAIVSQTAGLYLCQAIGGGATPPYLSVKLVATSAILAIGLINMISVRATAMVINVFTVTKVLALIFIILIGVWQLIVGDYNDNFRNVFEGTSSKLEDIALAFYLIMYSYDGWNSLSYIVEESKNPERNLFRGLLIALPIVTICYVSVNVAYYAGLTKTELLSSPATALVFAESTLGTAGLTVVSILVATSGIGAAMTNTYSGPRATFSAARDGNLPKVLCLLQNTSKTPVPAIILQCILSVLYVFGGNIQQLINGVGVSLWVFYLLVFISCIIMRVTKRKAKRPFKVWIIVPVLMILIALFLVIVPIALVPKERVTSLIVISIILSALPIYLLFGWDRLRPNVINRFSETVTSSIAALLDSSSAQV